MFIIIESSKGSYDSNIKNKKLRTEKNRPLITSAFIDILVDEYMLYMTDSDYAKYGGYENEFLKEEIKKEIEEKIKNNEKFLIYGEDEKILLSYNRQKTITEYTIPCSSLNEYQGKTVSIFSFQ